MELSTGGLGDENTAYLRFGPFKRQKVGVHQGGYAVLTPLISREVLDGRDERWPCTVYGLLGPVLNKNLAQKLGQKPSKTIKQLVFRDLPTKVLG